MNFFKDCFKFNTVREEIIRLLSNFCTAEKEDTIFLAIVFKTDHENISVVIATFKLKFRFNKNFNFFYKLNKVNIKKL